MEKHCVRCSSVASRTGAEFIAKLFPRVTVCVFYLPMRSAGIHHITAIAADPARNISPRFGRDDIRGFAAPTWQIRHPEVTEKLLTDILGFRFATEKGECRRFHGAGDAAASQVDLLSSPQSPGRIGVGSVRHIAFRAADENEQLRWREQLIEMGYAVSPVMDRNYFRSIYFREPGGIVFEIATDGPPFTIDKTPDTLGQSLKLRSSRCEPRSSGCCRRWKT
jgi:glyoxalase family protein